MQNKLLTITLFTVLFLLPFIFYTSHTTLWEEYSNNIQDKQAIIDNIQSFFFYQEELNYFDEDVKEHFYDVRNIHSRMWIIFLVAILLSFVLINIGANFALATKQASFLLLLFWVIMFTWAVIDFQSLFNLFHKTFFDGNYTFTPNNLVIQLFPSNFFFQMIKSIAISSVALSIFSYIPVYKSQ